jgi:hypothetical protein
MSMKKEDVLKAGLKAGLYRELPYVATVFTKTFYEVDKVPKERFRLYRNASGHYYYDLVNGELSLVAIEDADPNQPLFKTEDRITIVAGDIPNYSGAEPISTAAGTFLMNWVMLVHPFGSKIAYLNKAIEMKDILSVVSKTFLDDPAPGEPRDPTAIYVSEYIELSDACDYVEAMASMCTASVSRKLITPPPGVDEYRKKFMAEHKDSLDDLATIAKLGSELQKIDADYLKGDVAEKFLTNKGKRVVRPKMFLTYGAEVGLKTRGTKGSMIVPSLSEGWDIEKFPEMNDSLRSGTFDRGSQTMFGGVAYKGLDRASSNIRFLSVDCGSRTGAKRTVSSSAVSNLVGFTMVNENGDSVKLDSEETVGRFLGQVIRVRSPSYCRSAPDYCMVCVGPKLGINPYGGSQSINERGSAFLAMYLKAMHGKQLSTNRLNMKEVLS